MMELLQSVLFSALRCNTKVTLVRGRPTLLAFSVRLFQKAVQANFLNPPMDRSLL